MNSNCNDSANSDSQLLDMDNDQIWMKNEELDDFIKEFKQMTVLQSSVPQEIEMNSDEIVELLLKDYKLEAFTSVTEGVRIPRSLLTEQKLLEYLPPNCTVGNNCNCSINRKGYVQRTKCYDLLFPFMMSLPAY